MALEHPALFHLLMREDLIGESLLKENMDTILRSGNTEITAMALEYKNRLAAETEHDPLEEFTLDELPETDTANTEGFRIDGHTLVSYSGVGGHVVIPDNVATIGESAFKDCESLTSITIPNSVTSIGSSAFSGCKSLTSIIIPDGVTSIGNRTFWACYNLTSITIPNSVTSIGMSAFWYCCSLTSVTIPDSVTSIGSWAFEDCKNLTSITIRNRTAVISRSAFSGCSSLKSITAPYGATFAGIATDFPDGVYLNRNSGPFAKLKQWLRNLFRSR